MPADADPAPAPPAPAPAPVGAHLRLWRRRRGLSQMDLALDAGVSPRHLSFVESGRARASADLLLRLADRLDLPLRDRNALLVSGGYAPRYPEHPFAGPELGAARAAVERLLAAHAPWPALAVDRRWTLLAANEPLRPLLAGVGDPRLLEPPVNVLRVALHPRGLAPRIANLPEWRAHLLHRLRAQIRAAGDPALQALLRELLAYGAADREADGPAEAHGPGALLVPLVLDAPAGRLSLISTTTVFGAPAEVTLAELALETFLPADAETAARLSGAAVSPAGAAA
jgi:transcriptional regulator with XRE-family HTH domain